VVSKGPTAAVASSLLDLVSPLRRRGLPYARYLHAAERAAGALNAPGAPESAWLVLPAPLASLFLLTGKDLYKKALAAIKETYFAEGSPPGAGLAASRVHDVLLAARAVGELGELGFAVKGLDACFNALLPWIYLNHTPGLPDSADTAGGLLEELGANRLLFRGFELSYLLGRLNALGGYRPLATLKDLLPRILAFTLRQPAGTSHLSLSEPATAGTLDAGVLVRELDFRTRLVVELPELLRRGK